MAQEVRGVIAPVKGEPVRVETIVAPDPAPTSSPTSHA